MTKRLKLGLWTPLPHTIRPEPEMVAGIASLTATGGGLEAGTRDPSYAMALKLVRRAEELGFDITLVAERFLGPDLESWALASALAVSTSRIEIIAAVHPGMITPQVTAKIAATIDRISGGRFVINIVNGWWKEEFDMFSNGGWLTDGDERYRRMDEFTEVLKRLSAGETFSFNGEFYRFENGHLPTRMIRPSLPIYTASRSDNGKDTIARHGDLWFVNYEPDFRKFEQNLNEIERDIVDMRARAAAYGREMAFGMSAHVICSDTDAEAEALAVELQESSRANPVAGLPARALGGGLIGSAQRIAERLNRYSEIGLDCVMMHFHPMADGLERFAAEVRPKLVQ